MPTPGGPVLAPIKVPVLECLRPTKERSHLCPRERLTARIHHPRRLIRFQHRGIALPGQIPSTILGFRLEHGIRDNRRLERRGATIVDTALEHRAILLVERNHPVEQTVDH